MVTTWERAPREVHQDHGGVGGAGDRSRDQRVLGTLTPTYFPKSTSHIPYISVSRINTSGHIATTEVWCHLMDADCCPSGRAYTV
jgi:hypothetical protein